MATAAPDKNKIGKPVEIWYDDHFQPIGPAILYSTDMYTPIVYNM